MNANACSELKVRAVHRLGKAGNETSGPCVVRLVLDDPGWGRWTPGQFVMVRPHGWGLEPLWGRPFSIHRLDGEGLSLLIAVVGRGTSRLAALESGRAVTVWGPLGNGFVVRETGPTLLLAGGIGIAPFAAYAARHPNPDTLRLLFGHTAPLDRFPVDEMASLMPAQESVRTMHDQGRPGDIPALLSAMDTAMDEAAGSGGLALACGPEPFLRAVQHKAAQRGLDCQLSLENRMACGVGACLGCVTDVPGPDGSVADLPVQVCSRGPVFWAHEVILGPAGCTGGHDMGVA